MSLSVRARSLAAVAVLISATTATAYAQANANGESSLAIPIEAESDGGTIRLTSTNGFSRRGGTAVIDPDGAAEVITYDGIDATTKDLFGVVRDEDNAVPHRQGTEVEPLRESSKPEFEPAHDPPQPDSVPHDPSAHPPTAHNHGATYDASGDTGGEVLGMPTYTWLSDHCTWDGANTIRPVYVYDAVNDPTPLDDQRVTDAFAKIRDEVQAADRAVAQSHDSFKAHMRLRCKRDTYAVAWSDIDIASYAPPVSTSTVPGENTDADKNNNGFLECGEILGYLIDSSPYGKAAGLNRRHLFYLDTSLGGDECSNGSTDVHPSDARWDDPGTSNIGNTTYGTPSVDYNDWSATGVSGRSTLVTMHEFHHSIGAVSWTAPNECCGTTKRAHTSDHPDVMNGGYCNPLQYQADCYPWEESEITRNCSANLPAGLTYRHTYMDCGRDDYWAPNAGTASWLCTHYNIAWDSLYYHQRATPTSGCR